MSDSIEVLVVGAGPVGLALATDLGLRGVQCSVVERESAHSPLPKMNHVNTRSMELCRRWGLADAVRAAGWPDDHPMDVAYLTSLAGFEIARFEFPPHRDRERPDYTPEPSQRCPQLWFDPLLERNLGTLPTVRVRRGTELVSFEERPDGVLAMLRAADGGPSETLACRFLVGADGASSGVRGAAGIELERIGPTPQQLAISFRTKDFFRVHDKRRAAFYWVLDDEGVRGLVTPTDGETLWRVNWNLRAGERVEDVDVARAVRRIVGAELDYELITTMPWQIRFSLAERLRRGNVFLAGDAAHTLAPTGGLGMNTGLADAADLGWKLAGALAGWGGDGLLESYDVERRSAAQRVMQESFANLARVARLPRFAGIDAPGPDGERLRSDARKLLEEGDFRLEWLNDGASLGTRYTDSPCVAGDGTPEPPYDPNHHVQTSFPGCRAPHVPLADGRSTLDLFGTHFVLLRLGSRAPAVDGFESAARGAGLPLDVVALDESAVLAEYERLLVLVRPDGFVGWRGDAPPADPRAVIDRVRGAG